MDTGQTMIPLDMHVWDFANSLNVHVSAVFRIRRDKLYLQT